MKRSPMPRRRAGLASGGPPHRRGRLTSKRSSGRARPDEPLADWCAAQIEGECLGRATQRHHILPRSAGGDDSPENTADLCLGCHSFIHSHPTFGYESGYLRRRT